MLASARDVSITSSASKRKTAGYTPRVSITVNLRWSLKIYISNKFQGDTNMMLI